MGRPCKEINPEPGKRLRILCDECGVSQKSLAECVYISEQTISKIVNGKANLTRETAEKVIEKFPKYNLEWLLAFSDEKTKAETLSNFFSTAAKETDLLWAGFLPFAQLAGYEIAFSSPTQSNLVEDALKMVRDGYTIQRADGKTVKISMDAMNDLQNDVFDFIKYRLNRLINIGR